MNNNPKFIYTLLVSIICWFIIDAIVIYVTDISVSRHLANILNMLF